MKDKNQKYSNETYYKIDAKEKDYLFISESQISEAGKGLFTAIPLYKDDIISIFKGEILTTEEAKSRTLQGRNQYFMNLPDGKILDAAKTKCFAKYANDAKGIVKSKLKNNAKISLNENDQVCLVALRKIKSLEEIFCDYGLVYWKSHQ